MSDIGDASFVVEDGLKDGDDDSNKLCDNADGIDKDDDENKDEDDVVDGNDKDTFDMNTDVSEIFSDDVVIGNGDDGEGDDGDKL